MQSNVPVVVVGGTLNNLGVLRSLSHGGMPIFLLETTRLCAAGWSRHANFVPIPSLEGRSLIDSLAALRLRLSERPVLFLGADQSVDAVSAHRETIEPLYRISLPPADIVRSLAEKVLFHELAERSGFAVPRGVGLASAADLPRLRLLVPPVVIKPSNKVLVLQGTVERAVRANTLAEAHAICARMLERAPLVIAQEWIDGPDDAIFFNLFSCDRNGRVLGQFCGRKLVCSPPAVGNTAVCVAAPEVADELSAQTLDFISRVGYRGLGSLEFKRDSRTGRFMIIEPTVGRTDWQEEIATLCGTNLPLLTYYGELDRPPASEPRVPRPVAWRSSIEHRVPAGALLRGYRTVDGYFRWSDPLPALYYYGVDRFAARLVGRVGRLFSSR